MLKNDNIEQNLMSNELTIEYNELAKTIIIKEAGYEIENLVWKK